jgi:hypothetical protein
VLMKLSPKRVTWYDRPCVLMCASDHEATSGEG